MKQQYTQGLVLTNRRKRVARLIPKGQLVLTKL